MLNRKPLARKGRWTKTYLQKIKVEKEGGTESGVREVRKRNQNVCLMFVSKSNILKMWAVKTYNTSYEKKLRYNYECRIKNRNSCAQPHVEKRRLANCFRRGKHSTFWASHFFETCESMTKFWNTVSHSPLAGHGDGMGWVAYVPPKKSQKKPGNSTPPEGVVFPLFWPHRILSEIGTLCWGNSPVVGWLPGIDWLV